MDNKPINLDSKRVAPIIASSIITFCICLILFGAFYKYYLGELVIETTKVEKDITITDTGIADAVSKVYDSVVVIENYVGSREYATGTGFVFKTDDAKAYILTNHHVIDSASEVYVIFTNEGRVKAEIVGSDEYSDIVVLSVSKDNIISVAETGISSEMRVGDTTFAVGAPIDSATYSWSVTRGILSGKERLVEVSTNNGRSTYVMEVLQTDTAINSGNSGGPLCNSNGQVIGITNMKLASSSIEGMGFAIPIETAIEYAEMFINGGSISRPYLGVTFYSSTMSIFYENDNGVYIESVEVGGPADTAGLERGDKIIKINDKTVKDSSHFKYYLYKYSPGDKVTITYERNEKEATTEVILGSYNQSM